jgi:hypothetical protein
VPPPGQIRPDEFLKKPSKSHNNKQTGNWKNQRKMRARILLKTPHFGG